MSSLRYDVPDVSIIEDLVEASYNVRPCSFQVHAAVEQLRRRDVITIAPTGAGKTLTFWIPLLFNGDGISIVITALNGLGDQNIAELKQLQVSAVNVTAQNASDQLFKEIEQRKYRVVIMSPELVTNDKRVNMILWRSKSFVAHIFNVTIDEGHCVSEWGKEFRPEYSHLGRLRWILPPHIPFHIVSATMPARILKNVISTLNMRRENISKIQLSNDRPRIHLMVVELIYSTKSMLDLNRVIRIRPSSYALDDSSPLVKFMVFCNSRQETQRVAKFLRNQLPPDLQEKIIWFHSGMTQEFRAEMIERLRNGTIWGICCTDAAGMGLDIRDVELVIQWGYLKSLCTLMQRLGRGARGSDVEATGVYFVDKSYKTKSKMSTATKRKSKSQGGKMRKKPRVASSSTTACLPEISEGGTAEGDEMDQDSDDSSSEEDVPSSGSDPTPNPHIPSPSSQPANVDILKLLPSPLGLDENEYESAVMDVFITAHTHSLCRRRVADEYFGNNVSCINVADQCGCERCKKRTCKPRYCCDVCNPEAFLLLHVPPLQKAKQTRRQKLQAYTMEAKHYALKEELLAWRKKQLIDERMDDDFFGAHLILTDDLITRIIDLAHHFKLPDIHTLKAQTNWVFAQEYGEIVLSLAHKHFPPVSLPPANTSIPSAVAIATAPVPQMHVTAATPSIASKKPRKQTQCSRCKAFGHNMANRRCPLWEPKPKAT